MKELEGGCHAPIAVETSVSGPSAAATDEATLTLTAAVYSLDGVQCVKVCAPSDVPPRAEPARDRVAVGPTESHICCGRVRGLL